MFSEVSVRLSMRGMGWVPTVQVLYRQVLFRSSLQLSFSAISFNYHPHPKDGGG